MKLAIFILSLNLIWDAVMLNGIVAHSQFPVLSWIVAGVFLLGLAGIVYSIVSALTAIREWQGCRM